MLNNLRWTKLSILIVDDDEGIRETMSDILKEKNFNVQTACNGLEALKILESESFEAILMDLRMPGLDGIETSKRIMEIKSDSKIYMISGYISQKVYEDARRIGIQAIFSKPINFNQLEKILE